MLVVKKGKGWDFLYNLVKYDIPLIFYLALNCAPPLWPRKITLKYDNLR